jgi:amino acid transporter
MNFNHRLARVVVGVILLTVAGLIFTHIPHTFAQGTTVVDQPTNGDAGGFVICGNKAAEPCQIGHLFALAIVVINYLIAMAGLIAIVAIVYAGFLMIYSQGAEQLKEARGRFSGAIIGLVLVAGAYVLINSLFTGTLSIGVCEGESILTNPLQYIQSQGCVPGK